jgi:hypothetical protein
MREPLRCNSDRTASIGVAIIGSNVYNRNAGQRVTQDAKYLHLVRVKELVYTRRAMYSSLQLAPPHMWGARLSKEVDT